MFTLTTCLSTLISCSTLLSLICSTAPPPSIAPSPLGSSSPLSPTALTSKSSTPSLLCIPTSSNADGAFPFAPLTQDANGALYGTTSLGDPACDGALFALQTHGTHFQILHAFSGPDAALPYGGVVESKDGWLYGVAEEGGKYGKGVVYRVRTDGSGYSVLHAFSGEEGAYPLLVELVLGEGGWLYGTTSAGGVNGKGVVFGVKVDGSGYKVLHAFARGESDGAYGIGQLVLVSYGVTGGGGQRQEGVVFGVSVDGVGYRLLQRLGEKQRGKWPLV